jgi:hypothetical protein
LSIHRVDPRFVLPGLVERAVVLGGLSAWRDGLEEAGIDVTEQPTANASYQLAVAPAAYASDAVAVGADAVVVEGAGGARILRRAGLDVTRLIPIPAIADPRHLANADHRRAAAYAIEHWSIPTSVPRRVRNAVAKSLISLGRLPERLPSVAVGTATGDPPFLLAAARELGVPAEGEWFMTLGGFDLLSRSVFQVFGPDAAEPDWVVKFARVPGYTVPFERDEYGTSLLLAAGDTLSAHVPRILGRFDVAGIHASVETAAPGYRLTDYLQRRISRAEKVSVIDAVAAWLLELGKRTAHEGQSLGPERRHVSTDVLPVWAADRVPPTLADSLPQLPSVLQHGNVGAWNVIAGGPAEFWVIDWESARERSFPLWDLLFFLSDALVHLDGATGQDERDRHTARLFRGEIPSSDTLFRWIGEYVRTLELPPDCVGPLTTLCWLDHAAADSARLAGGTARGGTGPTGETHSARIARLWLREPGLGPTWDLWRTGRSMTLGVPVGGRNGFNGT